MIVKQARDGDADRLLGGVRTVGRQQQNNEVFITIWVTI